MEKKWVILIVIVIAVAIFVGAVSLYFYNKNYNQKGTLVGGATRTNTQKGGNSKSSESAETTNKKDPHKTRVLTDAEDAIKSIGGYQIKVEILESQDDFSRVAKTLPPKGDGFYEYFFNEKQKNLDYKIESGYAEWGYLMFVKFKVKSTSNEVPMYAYFQLFKKPGQEDTLFYDSIVPERAF